LALFLHRDLALREAIMQNILGCVLMAAITFPVAFFVARGCLRGFIRVITGGGHRDVL
jgi:hypothetical protein